jgi:hypothetical protein
MLNEDVAERLRDGTQLRLSRFDSGHPLQFRVATLPTTPNAWRWISHLRAIGVLLTEGVWRHGRKRQQQGMGLGPEGETFFLPSERRKLNELEA